MLIYGTALLGGCLLGGRLAGAWLARQVGVAGDVGGVGIAML
ncbi:MAG: malonate transporter, partial [Planctomycetes bacterium]|nr:malonate transporter [Planctomycetota bacterium]